jgi:hypothetical protein
LFITDIETVKKEIIDDFLYNRLPITREALLQCFANHRALFNKGYLTFKNLTLLDNAVKSIWEDTFHVKIGDFLRYI